MLPREEALERASYQCEAMVMTAFQRWTRCGKSPVEVHHALTRARGGTILDKAGESYHLICLCKEHHRGADGEDAYEGELLIAGYMTTEKGRPVYQARDPSVN